MASQVNPREDTGPFGRNARLRCKAQLEQVRSKGTSYAARSCVVDILLTPPDSSKKAAFSISKRYSLLAVHRNRARRLFRECYRVLYPALPPCWLILIPRKRMMDARQQEVLNDIRYCLRKLEVPLAESEAISNL